MRQLLLILLLALSNSLFAQNTLTGRIVDQSSEQPVAFASVIIKDIEMDTVVTGVKTDLDGNFELKTSKSSFHLEFRALGYTSLHKKDVEMSSNVLDLGTIKLEIISQSLEEVEIVFEKSYTEFRLDKRVFNVGKDLSMSGAGAMEVLNHVPSVTVTLEGVVSLRGGSGVLLLIDGKPSVMSDDPSKALGSITADMIDRIEVITNPSAKYAAEGTTGIINVILKKDQKRGVNGSVSINGGWPHNHSLGFSLNARTEKFNIFTQLGAGYRSLPRDNKFISRDLLDSTEISSDGIYYRNETFANATLGADFYLNKYNTITLSGRFAYEWEQQPSNTNFYEADLDGNLISSWTRNETTQAENPKYQYDLQYAKVFKDSSTHTLVFSTQGRFFGKDQSSRFENTAVSGGNSYNPQFTRANFKQANYDAKLDYFRPLGKNYTIETGALYQTNGVGNDYAVENEINGVLEADSSLTNNFQYQQNVLGVYASGSYESEKWGVKLGLRVENTDLSTELITTNVTNRQNFTNLFPTAHSSYKFSKKASMQLGYSRRVTRPRLWDLNPFFNISNNFSIRRGNPDLLPEFTDSYELMSIFEWDKFNTNFGIYYRHTDELIERVSIFENNVNTVLPMNIGTNDLVGVEWNAKYDPLKWLSFNIDFNYNYFNRKGEFDGQIFDFEGGKYTSKLMTKINLGKKVDIQLTGNYRSRYKTVQGESLDQAFLDAGIRLKLWKGKGAVNFGVRDVFRSRIERDVVDQDDFYLYRESTRGRVMTLGFSYSFGKGDAVSYSGGGHHH
jgi:outer membrane receptor for ferrienterochelin and colicin